MTGAGPRIAHFRGCPPKGCDATGSSPRSDQAGLLRRLVMLADDAATVETRTGPRETWLRKPTEPGEYWRGSWHNKPEGRRRRHLRVRTEEDDGR